jgi:hypothetical protein
MKKLVIFVLFVGLLFAIFTGCGADKQLVEQPYQQPSQELLVQNYKVYTESLFTFNVGDPLNVLNSKAIFLAGDYFEPTLLFQDGKAIQRDTVYPVARDVPKLSLGELLSVKKNSAGHIQEMNVSFSRDEVVTFTFNFQLKGDGSFTLNGNAKLFVGGKEYNVSAQTKGGECLLMVDFTHEQEIIPDSKSAEGRPVSGTKIMKLKK